MKPTLTNDDPVGWYLANFSRGIDEAVYWDGRVVCNYPGQPNEDTLSVSHFTNFRRLVEVPEQPGDGKRE